MTAGVTSKVSPRRLPALSCASGQLLNILCQSLATTKYEMQIATVGRSEWVWNHFPVGDRKRVDLWGARLRPNAHNSKTDRQS